MLCRALLAVAVLSYVLCVLLLSGVQKEDIDAGTLRKLQRHNVNIDDINGQQLRKQCISKTSVPETSITTQADQRTERIKTEDLITKDIPTATEKDAADMTQLQKIFQYLEYKRKKDKLKGSKLTPGAVRPSRSPLSEDDTNINIEETTSKLLPKNTFNLDKDDEKANKIRVNKELEDLMNNWQANLDNMSVRTGPENTDTNLFQEITNSKSPKDVDYITKLVEEILSKRKLNQLNSTATPKNSNGKVIEEDRTFQPNDQLTNKTISATNYYLNNCNLGNIYAAKQGVEDKQETFNPDNQLNRVPNSAVRNEVHLCKRSESNEKKILRDEINDQVIRNILNKLKLESHSLKEFNNESATKTTIENAGSDPLINHVTAKNDYNIESNALTDSIAAFKNLTRTFMSNRQRESSKTRDTLKENLDSLATALETQSNIFKQIFNRQRDLIKITSVDKERLKLLDNENREEFPPIIFEPNQDGYVDKSYKKTHNAFLQPYKELQKIESREDIVINNGVDYNGKEKTTKSHNNMQYDVDLANHSERPWFYREVNNEQFKAKKKEITKGSLFEPNDNKKITKQVRNEKKWSPYFDTIDKNAPIVRTDDHKTQNNQQTLTVNSDRNFPGREISQKPSLVGLNQNNNEPIEANRDKEISRFECQSTQINRIECLPDMDYKSNWAYFRNKQNRKQKPDIEEHNEETEYFNYLLPSRPRVSKHKGTSIKNRIEKYIDEADIYDRNETNDSIKLPTNIINNIAKSIKEMVLKDLTTTTKTSLTTTTKPSTTVSSTVTTTTTSTTPKITTTTSESTEGTTTSHPSKIPDASKALEKIMEMFEQLNLMKNKMGKHKSIQYMEDIETTTKETTQKTIIRHKGQPEELASEDRPPFVSDSRPSYIPPSVQTGTQNANNLEVLQRVKENRTPPPVGQVKVDNDLPYDSQAMQSYPENRPPRLPQTVEQKPGNRKPYFPPPLQMREKNQLSYDPQIFKGNRESLSPYLSRAAEAKVENRMPYDPQAFQRSPENSVPYSQQYLQNNLGMNAPYGTHPLTSNPDYNVPYYTPSQSNPVNSLPFHSQPLSHVPYDPLPLQLDSKPSFYNSKIQLDPYSPKEVLQPVQQKPKPRKYAITVQTNSGEIAPLQIAVAKPMVQTIVLTTKSPAKLEQQSDETYENKRTSKKPSWWRHQVEKTRETPHKQYSQRHTHKDAYVEHPKVRKFKQDNEPQEHKPRNFHEIERFHEKLEKEDYTSQHEEERIAKRIQRPIVKTTNYDDTHFRNFLQTQQKVNAMLERILATSKNKPLSAEVL